MAGRRCPQAVHQEPALSMRAPALKAHDGLAALHVVCTRQEVPLGLAFQHTSWAMSAQERKERLVGLIQPGPEPCYWETLCLASPQLVCSSLAEWAAKDQSLCKHTEAMVLAPHRSAYLMVLTSHLQGKHVGGRRGGCALSFVSVFTTIT